MKYKAVLFDCDGVLVDSDTVCAPVLQIDLRERGLDVTLQEAAEIYSVGTMEQTAAEAAQRGARIPQNWVPIFYEKMFAALGAGTEAIPGVSDLLDRLIGEEILVAVASNGPVAKMEITLERAGLIDRLRPHIYSARDLANPKPAPDVYLHAANMLGVAAHDCVVVEDSPSGVMAAKYAGMHSIGFAAVSDGAKLVRADIVLEDAAAIARYLNL